MGDTKKIFIRALGKENPVFAQILGICSTLAVTNSVKNTLVMCLGLIFVLSLSNGSISLLRKWIPGRIRMMIEVLFIASFVIMVDLFLKAFFPEISRQLGPYVGLIITNCIIMGRAEAFALNNPPWPSFIDGLASGIGYAYVLLIIASARELLGSGSLWGYRIFGAFWVNWSIMLMAPGAFFMTAVFVWVVKSTFLLDKDSKEKKPS